MEPFKNYNFTNKNTSSFRYTNPSEDNKHEYSYTTNNNINLESYFNQPYIENTSNSYDINYLPITSEKNNNYSYIFPEVINSEKNNNNYSTYFEPTHSKEYISSTNYNNNSGNIKNTTKSNFSNFATVKPLQISTMDKNENINYNYYYSNKDILNPSKNVTYYTGDTTTYYTGLNTNNNIESNIISSTTNNLNNINLNENYNNNVIINNSSNINGNFNNAPISENTYNISYNNNLSNNKITNKNITINNNNINTHVIKNKKKNMNNINNNNFEGLNKINSNFILLKILNLVKDDNKYKLFMYSKKFQSKLGYKLNDYQIKSIERKGIKVCNYLSGFYDKKLGPHPRYNHINKTDGNKYEVNFTKDSLKNLFVNNLERLKIKFIKDYLIYYFKKYKENKKEDSNLYIDIFCPFFNLLSSQEYFSDLFTIPIDMPFIESNYIENEYISAFNRLNKLKNNYSILFKFNKAEDFNFFNSIINLNKVNKLTVYFELTNDEKEPKVERYDPTIPLSMLPRYKCNPTMFFKDKFNRLFNEILIGKRHLLYNLKYLNIIANRNMEFEFDFYFSFNNIELNLISNLNNFESLIHLELENFKFKEPKFILKSNSIKVFKIRKCSGIAISENDCSNLKELFIYESDISYINSPLKFPNLEILQSYCYLDDNNFKYEYNLIPILNASIDFASLSNLKILKIEGEDFLKLENNTLESLTVVSNDVNETKEKKIIEKIISMKSLKEVTISLKTINNDNITDIPGENPSVEKLEIYWDKTTPECNIFNLQKKFPNVKILSLTAPSINASRTNLKIEENKNCKINSLSLYGFSDIKLYISSFENLAEFELIMFLDKGMRIKEGLPFMHKNCNIIFKSMTSFKFKVYDLEYELLDNIIDNLDKMPNLKTLELKSYTSVDSIIYNKLNKKISSIGLINIDIMLYFSTAYRGHKDKIINVLDKNGITIRK